MTHLPLTFNCQGKLCAATLDSAPGSTGLLIVSGGNEIRAGAFNGQALLASEIAAAGFPVMRFDRRGIGDSEGEDRGYRKSRKDIAAALQAFRALAPQIDRVVGYGNCDAASALMLFEGAGCDSLVLTNPWAFDPGNEHSMPTSSLRQRYREKLKNPGEIGRLLSGRVDLRKLASGLRQAARPGPANSSLADELRSGLAQFDGPAHILLAENDRTAQHFAEIWTDDRWSRLTCRGANHAFVEPHAQSWLRDRLLESLRA